MGQVQRIPVEQDSTARIGAVTVIHRCGALLKSHVHFFCVLVDRVFEAGNEAGQPVWVRETPACASRPRTDPASNAC